MRVLLARIEKIDAAPFVFLVGAMSGVLQGLPAVLLANDAGAVRSYIQLGVLAATTILWWAGAVLLWWAAVRRQQFSVWRSAGHVTLALAVGDLLTSMLALVGASFQTDGAMVGYLIHRPLDFAWGFVVPSAARSLIRFIVFSVAIALGRLVPGNGKAVSLSEVRPMTATRSPHGR
jgi:hypothetical protein